MIVYKIILWVVFLTTNIQRSKGIKHEVGAMVDKQSKLYSENGIDGATTTTYMGIDNECSDRFFDTECTAVEKCETLRTVFQKSDQTLDDIFFLINRNCEYSRGKYTKICCPKYTKCETSDGVKGQCINATDCSTANSATITRCDDPNYICCPFPPVPRAEEEPIPPTSIATDTRCPATILPPGPESDCCESYGEVDKITGGDVAAIDQFPWMALIEYASDYPDKPDTLCGGALISAAHVLTAAHCVSNSSNITGVRLGEYNTSNPGADCVLTAGGGMDCTDGAVSIPVQLAVVHELYRAGQEKRHDIALIKLARMVQFTGFITPICLPSTNISANPPADRLIVAGWGSTHTNRDRTMSLIKLFVEVPFGNFNTCAASYSSRKNPLSLSHGQICAGGEPGRDSCYGDSGGPLMYFNNNRVHIVGLVSFGGFPCDRALPGVYTSVIEYLDWIKSHMTGPAPPAYSELPRTDQSTLWRSIHDAPSGTWSPH